METNKLIYSVETENSTLENFYYANTHLPQVREPSHRILEEQRGDLLKAFQDTQFLPYASNDFDNPRPILQGSYFDEYSLKKVKERCGCSKGKKGMGFSISKENENEEKCNLH